MKHRIIYLFSCVALLLGSCVKDDDATIVPVNHTLFVYMVADNSLNQDVDGNLNKMYAAATKQTLRGGRLIIYLDGKNEDPTLFEIGENALGKVTKRLLKNYPEQNSASPQVFGSVLNDLRQMVPSASYGLVMWSHGTGWIPTSLLLNGSKSLSANVQKIGIPNGIATRSIGEDYDNYMEVDDMARAIPNGMFEYIIFDACYMGGVEIAYELREKTHYIVASSAQELAEGMPYDMILGDCFSGNLSSVCEKFYNYYNSLIGANRSATMALYDCSKLEELADATRAIMNNYAQQIKTLNPNNIQYFDFLNPHFMFDMQDVVAHLITDPQDMQRTTFERALNNVVVTKYNTEQIFGVLNINTFCGISMYVPLYTKYDAAFRKYAWAQTVF